MPEDFEYVDGLEELKRLCDEQGLDHMDSEAAACETVIFVDREGNPHECWEAGPDGRINVTIAMTPEQAVAATLGPATCHLEEIEKDCDTASEYMLDRECCFDAVYRCSCGCRFGHVAHNRPRFCPNCGAKAVGE